VVGGGLVFVFPEGSWTAELASVWFDRAVSFWTCCIEEGAFALVNYEIVPVAYCLCHT